MKKVTVVIPYLFEEYLIIALDSKWIKIFGSIPTFTVFIEGSKLHLVSNEEIRK